MKRVRLNEYRGKPVSLVSGFPWHPFHFLPPLRPHPEDGLNGSNRAIVIENNYFKSDNLPKITNLHSSARRDPPVKRALYTRIEHELF